MGQTESELPLTTRQRAVCDLVVMGLTAKQIGQKLGIGSRTVESHRDAIYRKLGVHNAIELVRKTMGALE